MRAGRDCASYYYRNCADLKCFAEFARNCPNAKSATEQTIVLPTYPSYGPAEAEKNIKAICGFFDK